MTSHTNCGQRYHYFLLQRGTLPLSPNGNVDYTLEHRCSSVLIWPEGESPSSQNTLLTDPCFTAQGLSNAKRVLARFGLQFTDIGEIFITHRHGDHLPTIPSHQHALHVRERASVSLSGVTTVPCFGHATDLHALVFCSISGENVWVVGDAILNLAWLSAWKYYWPNLYGSHEIVQTWESVARILSRADVVIPGHGGLITITATLLEELIATFPRAEYTEKCRDVESLLGERLQHLRAKNSK